MGNNTVLDTVEYARNKVHINIVGLLYAIIESNSIDLTTFVSIVAWNMILPANFAHIMPRRVPGAVYQIFTG